MVTGLLSTAQQQSRGKQSISNQRQESRQGPSMIMHIIDSKS